VSEPSFSDREDRARRLLRKLSDHARLQEPSVGDSASPARAGGPDAPLAFLRYEVREKVGEGATAVVYRAWDRELNRLVALKVLKESQALVDTGRQRFRRESQAAAGLSHPNVVPVYDVGEENGRLFIVMEFVDGRPLSDVLPGAPEAQRVAILERVARGVAAAHARGIVHRDLKPGNILVTAAGEPKVADFGLAHLQDDVSKLTRTGSTLGTPLYMSPEQVRGQAREISPRTDVYALGVMLYEAVAGRPPHGAETLLDLYQKILEEDPAPLRRFQPDASGELDTIARKALSKDPAGRYPSAAEFAEDLRRHAAGEPILARPESFPKRLWRKALRRRGAAALALAASAVLAAAWWTGSREVPATAIVEEMVGDVQLSWSGATAVGKGHRLLPGQILRAGPSGAATLKVDGGGRLWLDAHSMVQVLPGTRDGFFVPLGTASGERVTIRTPHGQAELDRGAARVDAFPTATWVEVTRGTARVRDLRDGRTEEVPEGFFIAIGAGCEYARRPAGEGLRGHWPFEEGTGNVARDASGHGNDGVFRDAPALQDGRKGKSVALDGTNFLDVPGLSGEKFPASGTLAFWVKGDFATQEFTELFDRYDRSRPHLFIRGMRSPHGLQVVFQQNGYVFERLSAIAEGEWNHIAVTWDTAAKKGALYLNGALSFTAPISDAAWVPSGQFFRVGGTGYSASAFRGLLDDVRLYGAPLRPEAIRDLYSR
jgi:tRNA A-37 threonylcarbamoyl transferase component Bud32